MIEDDSYASAQEELRLRELFDRIQKNPRQKNALLLDWVSKVQCEGGREKARFAFLLAFIAMERGEMGQPIQININNSSVANLNLGEQIGTINNAVSALSKADSTHQDVARALKSITEALLNNEQLNPSDKKDAAQVLAEIAAQAQSDPEKRSTGKIRALLSGLPTMLVAAKDLTELWNAWAPAVRHFFGL